ncbi:hypothetical protein D3C71_1642270 [compost metagenome]
MFGERHTGNAQLLFRFATGGIQHVLPALHHPTRSGVQPARIEIFNIGATLHQNFSHSIMHHNIGSTMTQPLSTHLLATGLSNHFILLVDDINPLGICSLTLFRHPLKPSILARCIPRTG